MTMTEPIRFDNGAAYERYMGKWSQLAGSAFLAWLAPASGLRWLDVGCGNGAFTEMVATRCAPASIAGIDPSAAVLAYARSRPALRAARILRGDAMALPFPDAGFDVAVMPLVIFFVPEPARGVSEMARVVAPGGVVSAYSWDMPGGGFPYRHVREELCAMGFATPEAPSNDASRPEVLLRLWQAAGLAGIESRRFIVERTYADFDDYWTTVLGGPSTSAALRALQPADIARLQERLRRRLPPDSAGRITFGARVQADDRNGQGQPGVDAVLLAEPRAPEARECAGGFEGRSPDGCHRAAPVEDGQPDPDLFGSGDFHRAARGAVSRSAMHERAAFLIAALRLKPHPEGGHYAEVFRSPDRVQTPRGERSALTTIDFMLVHGEFSAWHRVVSDEAWHLLEGGPLLLHVVAADFSHVETVELGATTRRHVVPAGAWQAAEAGGVFAYVGATVGPGFEFTDFSFGRDDRGLRAALPQLAPALTRLL
jgi:predicted cupin superfamily sugar epimerase/ubiquinone/menaquinone biosynthesis C-methylase UbiE